MEKPCVANLDQFKVNAHYIIDHMVLKKHDLTDKWGVVEEMSTANQWKQNAA